ncbi:MAG: hypothetical protein ACTSVZ_10405 [Promethearchaeota archaeon]
MSLMKYTIRRLLALFPMIFGILFLNFILYRFMPGNPYNLYYYRTSCISSLSKRENILREIARLKLDKPVVIQFITYCKICVGSFFTYLIFAYMVGMIIYFSGSAIIEIKRKFVKNRVMLFAPRK